MNSQPLSLGVLTSTLAIGGAEQLLLELLRRLDPGRLRPRLYLLGEPGPIGQEIIGLGLPWQAHLRRGPMGALTIPNLAQAFARDKVQALLLINHRNALAYGVPAAALAGLAPVVNWENETFKRYRFHGAFMLLRRLLMARVDAVVAAARGHRLYIAEHEHVPLVKVTCIPNGVDGSRFTSELSPEQAKARLGIPVSREVAGILAALRPDKAHEVFLEAAAKVVSEGLEAHFLIIGDGPRREALEALASRLGLTDRVSFLGFRRELGDIFAAMDLGVLSSMPRQETLSVAALEIMSAGVPMVATRVGFMSEIVIPGRTGLLVAPGEAQDLGRAMAELLRDDSRRLAMGQAAQDMVAREYGLDSMARSFEDLFQTLRSKKNPSRLRP